MSLAARSAQAIRELVDDQPILVGQRWGHALAFDARDLESERDDQCGVDGGGEERLEPGDQLVFPHVQPLHHDDRRLLFDLETDLAGP